MLNIIFFFFYQLMKFKIFNRFLTSIMIIVISAKNAAAGISYENVDDEIWDGWSIAAYNGQWTNSRLPYFPYNLVTGNVTYAPTYISSIILSKNIGQININYGIAPSALQEWNLEFETTFSMHTGLQNHGEITAGLMLRTKDYEIGSIGDMNFGWANGLSYALKYPAYEKGTNGIRGQDTRKLQYYMGFEASFKPSIWKTTSLFWRLHHRSGIYGLISPAKTGSNYIGFGLRQEF